MATKKILSYNLNGIRAAIGHGVLDWFNAIDADIICVQETKAQPEQIPVFEFEALGYKNYWYSAQKKGYSGVGIISKTEPDDIIYGIGNKDYDNEGRVIRADYDDVSVISVYHPSGSMGIERIAFKLKWYEYFLNYIDELKKTRKKLIIAGDFNVCHQAIDIHDPVRNANVSGFLPEEREWMTRFIESGFIDTFRYFNKEPNNYTWWSYRANARPKNLGWRIDYIMTTQNLLPNIQRAAILPLAMHSDHCPIELDLEF